jgi:hypothetical protein
MLTTRTTDYGLFLDWCPGNYNWRADRGRGTDVREWLLTEVPAGVLSSGGSFATVRNRRAALTGCMSMLTTRSSMEESTQQIANLGSPCLLIAAPLNSNHRPVSASPKPVSCWPGRRPALPSCARKSQCGLCICAENRRKKTNVSCLPGLRGNLHRDRDGTLIALTHW